MLAQLAQLELQAYVELLDSQGLVDLLVMLARSEILVS
jgi:hypothetical protein